MNDKDTVITKALFYSTNNLKCHIKIIPNGFKNGFIISDLIDGKFFWFLDQRTPKVEQRLFLAEMLDVSDYVEEDK